MRLRNVASYSALHGASQALLIVAALGVAWAIGPAEFGRYAQFLSFTAICGAAFTLKYDALTAAADSRAKAAELAIRGLRHVAAGGLISAPVIVILHHFDWLPWISSAVIVVTAMATSAMAIASAFFLKGGRTMLATVPRVAFALCLFPVQYIFLLYGVRDAVIVGHAVTLALSSLAITLWSVREARPHARSGHPSRYFEYGWFTVAGLMNQIANNAPVQVIGLLFGSTWAGFYALANRLLGIPLLVVGNGISIAMAAELSNGGRSPPKMFGTFILAGLLFALAASLLGQPELLRMFDESWVTASWVIVACAPFFTLRICAIPAVAELTATKDGQFLFAWEGVRLAALAGLAASGPQDARLWIVAFATCWAGAYAALGLRGYSLAKRRSARQKPTTCAVPT